MTSVVEIDEKSGLVFIEGVKEMEKVVENHAFLRLLGREGGVHIGLQGRVVALEKRPDGVFWSLDCAGDIWVMQRRAHFRARVPASSKSYCEMAFPDGQTLEIRLTDMSQGGAGGILPFPGEGLDFEELPLDAGTPISAGTLKLADGVEIAFSGRVANVRWASRDERRWCVVGIEFDRVNPELERLISRFIRSWEREQRRRERGY